MSGKEDRWQHLVTLAFELDQKRTPERAAELVQSALEVFGPGIDPVEDFEGYAVRRYLLAMKAALESGT